ncbi:unnamed protein product [Cunninghamella blakesleeana]
MINSVLRRSVRFFTTESAATQTTPIPAPRGQITDVESFLKAIGRGCEEHSSKFETWDSLFTTPSRLMKTDMGISTQQRRYILGWIEQYKNGVEPYAIALSKKKK